MLTLVQILTTYTSAECFVHPMGLSLTGCRGWWSEVRLPCLWSGHLPEGSANRPSEWPLHDIHLFRDLTKQWISKIKKLQEQFNVNIVKFCILVKSIWVWFLTRRYLRNLNGNKCQPYHHLDAHSCQEGWRNVLCWKSRHLDLLRSRDLWPHPETDKGSGALAIPVCKLTNAANAQQIQSINRIST